MLEAGQSRLCGANTEKRKKQDEITSVCGDCWCLFCRSCLARHTGGYQFGAMFKEVILGTRQGPPSYLPVYLILI